MPPTIDSQTIPETAIQPEDAWLFGWDDTPGIVSVWAERSGQALVWQRLAGRVVCSTARFRPWLYATTLADLAHLGSTLAPVENPLDLDLNGKQPFSYRELAGADFDAVRAHPVRFATCFRRTMAATSNARF